MSILDIVLYGLICFTGGIVSMLGFLHRPHAKQGRDKRGRFTKASRSAVVPTHRE